MRQICLIKKKNFINDAHAKEIDYWKRAALGSKSEDEKKRLTDLAPFKVVLARKDAARSGKENIYKMLSYLISNYSPHTKEQAFIEDNPQVDRF